MFYKTIFDGYIICISKENGGVEITAEEYRTILDTIRNKPMPPAGFDYRLKTDLTWEQYELPAADPDPELSAEEAMSIILGGAADA